MELEKMKVSERIQRNIEGLEGLLQIALRINNPKYQREIRKDIEGLRKELRIQKVRDNET
jgi:predicted CopG family antitoxin